MGKTPSKRVLKRYKLLKSYLKRRGFAGVWLSRQEVEELVEALRPVCDPAKREGMEPSSSDR